MRHPPRSSNEPAAARVITASVLVVGLLVFARSLLAGDWDGDRAPSPFAWRDVAIVQLLAALPLACVLAVAARQRVPAAAGAGLAALGLGAGLLLLAPPAPLDLPPAPLLGHLLRALTAAALGFSAALAVLVLRGQRNPARIPLALATVAALLAVVLPGTYVGARCRHDIATLEEYLTQSRFGEARGLARGLLTLDTGRNMAGRPLADVAADIDRLVGELEARVATPLPRWAGTPERYERARLLAMLGRTEDALAALEPVRDPDAAPAVDNLRGTIHETRGEWDEALTCYERARDGWQARPPVPARAPELLKATTGVAYCLRKSGRYVAAEAAYQQVLALAPTAQSHYLLAQFYEDAQQSEKARCHARRAIELAPDQYTRDAERLIAKLAVYHFGCLGVFNAEADRAGSPIIPPRGIADR